MTQTSSQLKASSCALLKSNKAKMLATAHDQSHKTTNFEKQDRLVSLTVCLLDISFKKRANASIEEPGNARHMLQPGSYRS